MALNQFGFIVLGAGYDPAQHRVELRSTAVRTAIVGVSVHQDALTVAKSMVADGVQLIELCGAFGPIWAARVISAIGGVVPVGSVGYGAESIDQMHELFR